MRSCQMVLISCRLLSSVPVRHLRRSGTCTTASCWTSTAPSAVRRSTCSTTWRRDSRTSRPTGTYCIDISLFILCHTVHVRWRITGMSYRGVVYMRFDWLMDPSLPEKFNFSQLFDTSNGAKGTDRPTMHCEIAPCKVDEIRQRTCAVRKRC